MRVELRLLGDLEVIVDGAPVDKATLRRRDPAQLVGLLALARGHRVHREQVVEALWPDAPHDAVANRLHKAAHFVRKATGHSTGVVLSGETVALFPDDDVVVDVAEFDRLAGRALEGDATALSSALEIYAGDLLSFDPYEEWVFHPRQRLQLRHRELLRRAAQFDVLVGLDPTDEDAHVGLMHAMLRSGDRAGVLRQFDALAAILEHELGVGPSAEACSVRALAIGRAADAAGGRTVRRAEHPDPVTRTAPRAATLATQRVHFCRTSDGVRLAYASSGAGPPLVKASNWLTHLDHDWDSPVWRHWWQALSAHHTLVRYDERGCGLSDWDVDATSYTLDAWVRDLETVVDALGLERFPILGISQGGPIAIEYAARHPDRVSHLVVYGTCARATWARASPEQQRELAALGELIKTSWGGDQPGFRQVYDARFLPDGPLDTWRAFDELQRRSTSPQNAHRLWKAFGSLDCAAAARQLDVPTLVVHCTDDQVWPIDEAEELHAMVSGSRLVALASNNHILQAGEPAFARFVDEVERFLSTA